MKPTSKLIIPEHLFVSSCDGALHDTRKSDWAKKPLRPIYRRTFSRINTTAELKATLRNGAYAWPGGYPLYFITSDGAALSFQTVRKELHYVLDSIRTKAHDGWRVVACEVNWEIPDLYCEHSGKRIESAYAESEA